MRKITITVFLMLSLTINISAQETIKIAAVFSITGEASTTAEEHLLTVRYAVNEINQSGGILGKKIELIEYDNQSSSLGARHAARQAVKEDIAAAFGGSWSSHVLGMAPVFQKARIPFLTPVATHPDVSKTGNYIFRICFIDRFQGEALAKFAYQDLNAVNAAVLINTDQIFSIGLSEQFIKSFKQLGGKIADQFSYIENMSDYESLVSDLAKCSCDVIFLPGYSRDSAQIIKNARRVGINKTFIGGDGWSHLMFNYAPEAVENSYYLTHWHKSMKNRESLLFVEKMKTIFSENMINAGMALSYDMVYLLADAVERAGSTDRDAIRKAIENTMDYEGLTGTINFNKDGDPEKQAVIIKFTNDKSEFVKQID